jgi:hypothetical protein
VSETLYAIVPFIDLPQITTQAIDDLLAQEGVRVRVLGISNGSGGDTRKELEARQREHSWGDRVFFWWHHPPLPTLDASWNAGLEFVWAAGGERALVVNNDVRLHKVTAGLLLKASEVPDADGKLPLFVSAVGVRPALPEPYAFDLFMKGGPDFSCFVISKECHEKYPFDENFTYVGDLDLHRRIMLGGDGDRIFSVNVPYLHYGSQTIERSSPEKQAQIKATADLHRQIYAKKWAGGANEETALTPYGEPVHGGVCTTTPDLQAHRCAGFHRDGGTPLDPDSLREALANRQAGSTSAASSAPAAARK